MADEAVPAHRTADRAVHYLRSRWPVVAALILATVLAFGVRLWNLEVEPLHVDELRQVLEVQGPWDGIVEASFRHQQPPLDYLIGKAVVEVFGATDFTQRMPAAIAGAATIVLLTVLFARDGLLIAAGTVGLLGALHPFLVRYSQYARPYALPVFTVVLCLALYHLWYRGHRERWVGVAFGCAVALAVMSRALMPVVALGLLGAVSVVRAARRHGTNLRRAVRSDPLGLIVLPGVTAAVWIPAFLVLRHFGGSFLSRGDYDLWARLARGVENFGDFGERAVEPYALVPALVLCSVVLIVPSVRRVLQPNAHIWIPLLLVAPLFAIAHATTTIEGQFFADRYLVFLPLGVIVFAALAMEGLIRSARTPGGRVAFGVALTTLVAVSAMASWRVTAAQAREIETADWEAASDVIEARERPGDVIVAIDARPFRTGAHHWGWEASPRYYEGAAPFVRPIDVVNGDRAAVLDASRYHFVFFVPQWAGDPEWPESWTVDELVAITVVTTGDLVDGVDRIEAWWTVTAEMRPDVAVVTQVAGLALDVAINGRGFELGPWEDVVLDQATKMGLLDLARSHIAAAVAPG